MTTGDGLTGNGTTPRPDPTTLTDAAIERAITATRDYIDSQLAVRDVRLSGMDEATKLRVSSIDGLPAQIDEKVAHLAELTTTRFDAAERLRIEQKKDTKDAVDAALSAAKEAVKEQTTASERSIAKSETATSRQLEQQQETFTTAIEGLRRSLDELKDRMSEDARNLRQAIADVTQTANGSGEHRLGSRESYSDLRGLAMVAFGMIAAGAAIYAIVKP